MLGLVDNKKVVIVGIPGVGKTSLVTKLVELITQQNKTVGVHSFGTVMLEEAMKNGIKDRDELRTLPIMNKTYNTPLRGSNARRSSPLGGVM